MGVITYSQKITNVQVLFLDSQNMLPKIVPEGIKSIEFIEGDGGVGSIKQTNFSNSHIKYIKHKIDALDAGSFYCKYIMIESDIKFDKIDLVVEDVKFVAAGSGLLGQNP
ncbi:hypothetical protein EUGRSUZ_H04004 [Eucalyptus grandis]|uniref:Bet v I/Major latex protein domain-containing protein n=2 Tax=Eucalyptus grandis TaxID=71139 RepID=A0A059B5P1_EUCGR|nr:hypothetical protein EUGRSUZ_H04004 [Eucalyptus grandis]